MTRETIFPKDRAEWLSHRVKDITSTEGSALFGCNQYLSKAELWHRKKSNEIVEIGETEAMKWGTRMQKPIAEGIAEDLGLKIREMNEYMRLTEYGLGSSFDYAIEDDGLLEIKAVGERAFQSNWVVNGDNIEAPLYIEYQVQHELLVSGRKYCVVGALVGGNRTFTFRREPDLNLHDKILEGANWFWRSIKENQPPPFDFPRDAAFVTQMYSFANPGTVKDMSQDETVKELAFEYKNASETAKEAEKKKDEVKARLLIAIGDTEKVKGDGFSISAGMIGPCHVEFDRKGYRNFKLIWGGQK